MVLGRVKVRHVIELSRESGAVALLFCILFRRTVCRYILREISRFKLCSASTIVHLTVAAAAATTTATSMVLNGNISRARVERANAVIGRGESERVNKRERETVIRRRTDWLLVYRYGFHFQCHLDSYTNRFFLQDRDP